MADPFHPTHPIGNPPPPPAAEHVATNNNAVTISPTIPVSFVACGANSDGHQNPSLASGPSDGYEKTIAFAGGPPGCTLRLPFAVPGGMQISDLGGGAVVRWNASIAHWQIVGGFNVAPIPPLPLS